MHHPDPPNTKVTNTKHPNLWFFLIKIYSQDKIFPKIWFLISCKRKAHLRNPVLQSQDNRVLSLVRGWDGERLTVTGSHLRDMYRIQVDSDGWRQGARVAGTTAVMDFRTFLWRRVRRTRVFILCGLLSI